MNYKGIKSEDLSLHRSYFEEIFSHSNKIEEERIREESKHVFTNSKVKDLDFNNKDILIQLIKLSTNEDDLFSKDFDYSSFFEQILLSMLTFEEILIFFSSKLFLVLSYKTIHVTSYLSLHLNELITVLSLYKHNLNILILIENILLDSPSVIHELFELDIMGILCSSIENARFEHIKTIISIFQIMTLHTKHFSDIQIESCLNFCHFLFSKDFYDVLIYDSIFHTISHIQKYRYIQSFELFNEDEFIKIMHIFSNHQNICSILEVFSYLNDNEFHKKLFECGFFSAAESIFTCEKSTVWRNLITFFITQIKCNHNTVEYFSIFLPLVSIKMDDVSLNTKTDIFVYFLLCLKFMFHNIFQTDYFERVLIEIFDLVESVSNDFIFNFFSLILELLNNIEMGEFLAAHADCCQAVYNQCQADDPNVAEAAQAIIAHIKQMPVED